MDCKLLGIPLQVGTGRRGCEMGPSAYRTAGLAEALEELGHTVVDLGDIKPEPLDVPAHPNSVLKYLQENAGWIAGLTEAAYEMSADGFPIFMGGDHMLAAGTVAGISKRAQEEGREQFVLWLDAHTDFHTLDSSDSGNLHGTPVAYYTGQKGFEGYFPKLEAPVNPANVCMIGIRSVDPAERKAIRETDITVYDMRLVDEYGVSTLLKRFLTKVKEADGKLHVSLDVDFLDPSIAPAVGTTVPGGATFREAHLIMEMLHDSGLVTSLDLVELNPFLDERGRTAHMMVDLTASLFGRNVMDRPTLERFPL